MRICRDFVTRGRACTYRNCSFMHLTNWNQLEPDSATAVKAFIQAHPDYALAPLSSSGNPSITTNNTSTTQC